MLLAYVDGFSAVAGKKGLKGGFCTKARIKRAWGSKGLTHVELEDCEGRCMAMAAGADAVGAVAQWGPGGAQAPLVTVSFRAGADAWALEGLYGPGDGSWLYRTPYYGLVDFRTATSYAEEGVCLAAPPIYFGSWCMIPGPVPDVSGVRLEGAVLRELRGNAGVPVGGGVRRGELEIEGWLPCWGERWLTPVMVAGLMVEKRGESVHLYCTGDTVVVPCARSALALLGELASPPEFWRPSRLDAGSWARGEESAVCESMWRGRMSLVDGGEDGAVVWWACRHALVRRLFCGLHGSSLEGMAAEEVALARYMRGRAAALGEVFYRCFVEAFSGKNLGSDRAEVGGLREKAYACYGKASVVEDPKFCEFFSGAAAQGRRTEEAPPLGTQPCRLTPWSLRVNSPATRPAIHLARSPVNNCLYLRAAMGGTHAYAFQLAAGPQGPAK